jgi:glycosyltransferase involved in cell wall biosynthesis
VNPPPEFLHELETPAPLCAPGGALQLRGWCVHPSTRCAPSLRLVCCGQEFPVHSRLPRPDVCTAFALPAAALQCGFQLTSLIAPGVHLARLEASLDSSEWICLRRFTVAATAGPLQAAIEYPGTATVGGSVRIQGWCAHPELAIAEVWLHYGNRRLRCEHGLVRTDVPRLLPGSPDAARAGFISIKNLPVGCGPLRVCAVTTDGCRHFFATDRRIDIRTDEENPLPLDLSAAPARLGPLQPPATTTLQPTCAATPRRILFVLYGDMTSNSALHVAALANELSLQGHECVVAVPRNAETARYHPHARFRCVDFAACGSSGAVFRGGAGPHLVHAWTTREVVRRFCVRLLAGAAPCLVVHLEDHEARILESTLGRSEAELAALPSTDLVALVGEALSHPLRSGEFLRAAAACTVIIDRLQELLPPGKPARVIWPAATAAFFERPIPWELRTALGWERTHTVLFYHGNLHPTNRDELAALYEAVVELNATGTPTTLLRAGRDVCALPGDLGERAAPHVVALGRIGRHEHLAPLMALADFFVQPGEPDTFNDYRFPSKLPEFFSLGRPVILPRTNLGTVARHGLDAYIVDRADAAGIAQAVRALRADPALGATLSKGAAAFAREHFSWARSAAHLAKFYDTVLSPAKPYDTPPATKAIAMPPMVGVRV